MIGYVSPFASAASGQALIHLRPSLMCAVNSTLTRCRAASARVARYGPPPSYPNLKIAGLNAPIPEGCSFGYHAGGWGKPPVDEHGKPLYGDVFGVQGKDFDVSGDTAGGASQGRC